MNRPKVYAPQQPSRYDAATRLWVPTVNLSPAEAWGEVIVVLPPNANRLHTAPLVAALKERMAEYGEADYIMAVGDPSLIAAAACIAARATGGVVRMLKWEKMSRQYLPVEIVV
jgi:hypothetical protein